MKYPSHMKKRLVLSAIALAASASAALAATPTAGEWQIGPIIRGKNYSVGMPLQPAPTRNGWYFDFPHSSRAAGHVHYVSFRPESLADKARITVRFRVDAKRGTRFVPQEHPHLPGTVSLFLQRRGDNWTAKGRYNFYRWYAPADTVQEISPGTYQMTVRLDDPRWTPVMGSQPNGNTEAFRTALADPAAIGLVFGSAAARGHGVFATAPARFVLLDFNID